MDDPFAFAFSFLVSCESFRHSSLNQILFSNFVTPSWIKFPSISFRKVCVFIFSFWKLGIKEISMFFSASIILSKLFAYVWSVYRILERRVPNPTWWNQLRKLPCPKWRKHRMWKNFTIIHWSTLRKVELTSNRIKINLM